MATYTALLGHFASLNVKVGDTVKLGTKLGLEGSTGMSTGRHCHIAVAEGLIRNIDAMRLSPLNRGTTKPNRTQCERFNNKNLYTNGYFVVTTPYLDPTYVKQFGVKHPAIDTRAKGEGYAVRWPLTEAGRVVAVGRGDGGYGNYVLISYEVNPPKPTPIPARVFKYKVGDKVKIVKKGNAQANGKGKATSSLVLVFKKYITKIHKGAAYPYQVGNKGKTDGKNTTGFFKEDALKKA